MKLLCKKGVKIRPVDAEGRLAKTKRRPLIPFSVAFALALLQLLRARGQQNQADYKYEEYQEDKGRIHVGTHSILLDQNLASWIALSGTLVYDTISGNTPTGAPPSAAKAGVPFLTEMHDIRRAESIAAALHLGSQTITPGYAYSKEGDYESDGFSLTDSIEFNQKNTTLTAGISQNLDRVLPHRGEYVFQAVQKNATEGLIGLNQLLGPNTVLTANLTLGYDEGYLNDPYRGMLFEDINSLFAESRPRQKLDGIAFFELTHYFDAAHGSIEGSYRYYEDSYGVFAHTLSVAWLQKLTSHVILSPYFRFYNQTAADFYRLDFPASYGDPGFPMRPLPAYYSADYRLSELSSYTLGFKATLRINDHIYLDGDFKRYMMEGNDNKTSSSVYPSALIVSFGARILW